jgi:hypothetical protein
VAAAHVFAARVAERDGRHMKSVGRRLFARAAVGVPTALTMGGGIGLPQATTPPPPSMGMNVGRAIGDSSRDSLMSKVWDAFNKESKDERNAQDMRYIRRQMMGGLDPDLAVLNSMSLGRRVQLQIEREKAFQDRQRSLRSQIIRRLGGNPEDFE